MILLADRRFAMVRSNALPDARQQCASRTGAAELLRQQSDASKAGNAGSTKVLRPHAIERRVRRRMRTNRSPLLSRPGLTDPRRLKR